VIINHDLLRIRQNLIGGFITGAMITIPQHGRAEGKKRLYRYLQTKSSE